jgi:muramoyltetrapeptide carboxypeptidase LdcA involved in peptidoglycan recycling
VPASYPPPVEPGDTVALLSPSHAPPEAALERGVERLRSFGVEVTRYPTAERDTEWLKRHPDERAEDCHRAFRDDDVAGVVATMGGNVGHQLFSRLDPDVLESNPTRFYGGSDNTHLHSLLSHCGVVSFYGGQLFPDVSVDPEMHPYTRENVGRALRDSPFGDAAPAPEWTDEYDDLDADEPRSWFPADGWSWRVGDGRTVRAPLTGGCLSMLRTELALDTPFAGVEAFDEFVLAVETSGETPSAAEVERFFSVLGERGVLDRAVALLVAKPETPGGPVADRERYRTDQREAIRRTVAEYDGALPTVFDVDFGHAAPVLPVPLGAPVVVDAGAERIGFPEPSTG